MDKLVKLMSLLPFKITHLERLWAGVLLVLLLPSFCVLALWVRLETGRSIFRSARRFLAPDRPVIVTLFQTRDLAGRLGPFGRMLKSSGLHRLPMLIDVCAGRLSFKDPVPLCWKSVKRSGPWFGELQTGTPHLARRPKDRYRSAA